MKKIVVGQIIRDGKVMGTGFLAEPDIVITVKHNVIIADELLSDELEEKEVVFRIEEEEVVGKTINLLEAIEKGIDCVFIRLNEVLSEDEMYNLIDVQNEVVGGKLSDNRISQTCSREKGFVSQYYKCA